MGTHLKGSFSILSNVILSLSFPYKFLVSFFEFIYIGSIFVPHYWTYLLENFDSYLNQSFHKDLHDYKSNFC